MLNTFYLSDGLSLDAIIKTDLSLVQLQWLIDNCVTSLGDYGAEIMEQVLHNVGATIEWNYKADESNSVYW